MREQTSIRELLSQNELSALFSIRYGSDSDLNAGCETIQSNVEDDVMGVSAQAVELTSRKNIGEGQDEGLSNDSEVLKLAISLHESLSLGEILLACSHALEHFFSLKFLSFIQPRVDKTMVTIYSLDKSGNGPLVTPRVIDLKPSRLRECLLKNQRVIRYALKVDELDHAERDYFIPPHLESGAISIIYWPLSLNGEVTGVLVVGLTEEEHLTVTRRAFLAEICKHLANAINSSDTYYMLHRHSRQSAMLSEIAGQAASDSDLNTFLREACKSVRNSFEYNSVQIWMGTRSRFTLAGYACKSESGIIPGGQVPLIVQECSDQDQILCKNHAPEVSTETDCKGKSQFAAPIRLQGECIGVLFIESIHLDAFGSDDFKSIGSVASLIASRYHNVKLFNDFQRSGEYLKAILESAEDWATLSTDTHGYVLTCSAGSQQILHRPQKEALGKDVITLFTDPRIQQEILAFIEGRTGTPRYRCVKVAQSGSAGTTYLDVSFQRVCDSEEHHIGFVGAIRDISEKVLLERRLRTLSIRDDLTKLHNQRGFLRVLKKETMLCRMLHHNLSLCFLDIDNLKQCNDTYGHLFGSRILREMARLLQDSVRSTDTCCRYGGDEFVIIMPKTDKLEAQAAVERIRVRLNAYFQQKITASFGISDFSCEKNSVAELLAQADKALYRAKGLGKNCVMLSD